MRRKAAILDRDGVINEDRGYVHQPEDFVLLPDVLEGLRLLQDEGHAIVVVTNQSGIGRGFYTAREYQRVMLHMQSLFAAEGIALAGVYHCPHHPQAFVERVAETQRVRVRLGDRFGVRIEELDHRAKLPDVRRLHRRA